MNNTSQPINGNAQSNAPSALNVGCKAWKPAAPATGQPPASQAPTQPASIQPPVLNMGAGSFNPSSTSFTPGGFPGNFQAPQPPTPQMAQTYNPMMGQANGIGQTQAFRPQQTMYNQSQPLPNQGMPPVPGGQMMQNQYAQPANTNAGFQQSWQQQQTPQPAAPFQPSYNQFPNSQSQSYNAGGNSLYGQTQQAIQTSYNSFVPQSQPQPPANTMGGYQGNNQQAQPNTIGGYQGQQSQPHLYNNNMGGAPAYKQSWKNKNQTQGGQYQQKPRYENNDRGYNSYNQGGSQINGGQGGYNKTFNDWNSNQPMKDTSQYKMKNSYTQNANPVANAMASTLTAAVKTNLNANAGAWKPPSSYKAFVPSAAPVDVTTKTLKALGETDEDEIKKVKELIKELKTSLEESKKDENKSKQGVISMDLFKKIGELKICQVKEKNAEDLQHCMFPVLVEREIKCTNDMVVRRGKGQQDRGGRGRGGGLHGYGRGGRQNYNNHEGDDGDFTKGGAKPQNQHRHKNQGGWDNQSNWKAEDTEEKQKLKDKANAMLEKVRMVKNDNQKIRLILNVITPDNFEKKYRELRGYLFKDLKQRKECEDDGIEYVPEEHQLKEGEMDEEVLDTIVQNIFRKAQIEKEYCIFYGHLCENLIKLELGLRDQEVKIANMKNSQFRKSLFEVCKICFEKFFSVEEKAKHAESTERQLVFQAKLYGNIDFIGELYRRKILPETILVSVFKSLLGVSEMSEKVDDLIAEGAIKLMNKVGQNYEENLNSYADKKRDEKSKHYKSIVQRFRDLQHDDSGQYNISNRIKLLIQNMFENKDSGWLKTKDQNDSGPKTKAQVGMEIKEKYDREYQQREEGKGRYGGNDRRDNYNNNNNNRNDDRRRNDGGRHGNNYNDGGNDRNRGGGGQKYQRKDDRQPRGGYNDRGGEQEDEYGAREYGKGGREYRGNNNRGQDERKTHAPIVEMDDEEMGKKLKKNFETFAQKLENAQLEDNEEEDEEPKSNDEAFDLALYKKLKNENGKDYGHIFFSLLTKVFDEDTRKIEKHFTKYLDQLIAQKILTKKDFSTGISKFVQFFPELVLDVPQIHKYTWNYVIKPLVEKNNLQLKFITWIPDEKEKKEDDEDDIVFDSSDSYFMLMAIILKDQKTREKLSWDQTIEWYSNTMKWKEVSQAKHEKIEDSDVVWDSIKSEIGEADAAIVIPLLDQGKK